MRSRCGSIIAIAVACSVLLMTVGTSASLPRDHIRPGTKTHWIGHVDGSTSMPVDLYDVAGDGEAFGGDLGKTYRPGVSYARNWALWGTKTMTADGFTVAGTATIILSDPPETAPWSAEAVGNKMTGRLEAPWQTYTFTAECDTCSPSTTSSSAPPSSTTTTTSVRPSSTSTTTLVTSSTKPNSSPTTQVPGTPTTGTTANKGKDFCAELLKIFKERGEKVPPSTLTFDNDDLKGQFEAAINAYNQSHPDRQVHATGVTPWGGTAGAVAWLSAEGSMFAEQPTIAKQIHDAYLTGQEKALRDAIVARYDARSGAGVDARLDPGDVFSIALDLHKGDATKAMLAAHNTLRELGRGGDLDPPVAMDTAFIPKYLQPLRAGPEQTGPWYHLFGTGYYSMVRGADYGKAGDALFLAALFAGTLPVTWLTVLAGLATGVHAIAEPDFADWVEQVYREYGRGRAPDAEKYCMNIWGTELGRLLWESLPGTGDRPPPQSGFEAPPTPEHPPGPVDPFKSVAPTPVINMVESPFSIQISDDSGTFLLDQGAEPSTAQVFGEAAMTSLPVAESDSWGLIWLADEGVTQTVTLEATRPNAVLTLQRIDTATAAVATYRATAANKGDRFTIVTDDAKLDPDLTAPDGSVIRPTMSEMKVDGENVFTAAARPGGAGAADPTAAVSDTVYGIIGLALIFGVIAVFVFVVAALSRRKPAVAVSNGLVPFGSGGPTPGPMPAVAAPGVWAGSAARRVYVMHAQPMVDGSGAQTGSVLPGSYYDVLDERDGWAHVRGPDGQSAWTSAATLHNG